MLFIGHKVTANLYTKLMNSPYCYYMSSKILFIHTNHKKEEQNASH